MTPRGRTPVFDARRWRRLDWLLIAAAVGLVAFSLPTLYSASLSADSGATWGYVRRQALGLGLGAIAFVLVNTLDYRHFADLARPVYWACIGLLVLVLIVGREINGARSWFAFGGFRLQPSELAKVALILALARYFADDETDAAAWPCLLRSALIAALPVGLILLQPDLGTVLTFGACWLVMLWWSGARWPQLAAVVGVAVLAAVLMWRLDVLAPYQKARVTVLFNPEIDPRGQGYNLRQALIAVGSGGLTGQGWLEGTQTHLGFLPERRTDFLFCVLAEELGFLGACGLLACYGLLLWRAGTVAMVAETAFGRLLATGCCAVYAVHVTLNAGMVLGVLPITGLPLPFFSYGSSNLLTCFVLLAMLTNVGTRSGRVPY